MFNFKKLFQKEKWALVKSTVLVISYYRFHIHYFESSTGKRLVEYSQSGKSYDIKKDKYSLKSNDSWQLITYRWLSGRNDPEIPRYNDLAEQDKVNYLKGKIE